jgi:acyl carrier protein
VNDSGEKPLNESKPTTSVTSLSEIKELMREVLAAEMDIAVHEVPLEGSLVAAGVDSLAALGLCNKIKGQFQVPFELASVLSGKSISELSAEVLRGLKAHKVQSFAIPLQPRHN